MCLSVLLMYVYVCPIVVSGAYGTQKGDGVILRGWVKRKITRNLVLSHHGWIMDERFQAS